MSRAKTAEPIEITVWVVDSGEPKEVCVTRGNIGATAT